LIEDLSNSGEIVERASWVGGGEAACACCAEMVYPDDSAHSVQELLRHAEIPNESRHIVPEMGLDHHRKTGRIRVGKCGNHRRKVPYIDGAVIHGGNKNKSLSIDTEPKLAINLQFARIFDKNTIRHMFSSYV